MWFFMEDHSLIVGVGVGVGVVHLLKHQTPTIIGGMRFFMVRRTLTVD